MPVRKNLYFDRSLLLILFFLVKSVHAETLFIDTNMANTEVYMLNTSEFSPNVIFPAMPTEDRLAIDQINPRFNSLLKAGNQCNAQNKSNAQNKMHVRDCRSYWEPFGQLENERRKVFQRNRFDFIKLNDFLEKLEAQNHTFDKLVISGHNGLGDFYGDTGSLSIFELEKLLEQFPNLRNNVQSLLLWGCYTTTPHKVMTLWQPLFPNAKIIAGYNGMSARSDSSSNIRYLHAILKMATELGDSENSRAIVSQINSISKIEHLNFAVYQKQTGTYVSKKFSGDINEAQSQNCKSAESKMASNRNIFECYYYANNPRCTNVPANEHQSELRSTYNFLQAVDGCKNVSQGEVMSTSVAIRLIKFKNILKNFGTFYAVKLKEANAILAGLNAPEEMMIPEFEKANLSRAEVLLFLNHFYEFVQALPDQKDSQVVHLKVTYRLMSKSLYQLSASCVPFGWVEPDSSASVPQCVVWPAGSVNSETRIQSQAESNSAETELKSLLPTIQNLNVDIIKTKINEYLRSI